jgi:hypothetical protein
MMHGPINLKLNLFMACTKEAAMALEQDATIY